MDGPRPPGRHMGPKPLAAWSGTSSQGDVGRLAASWSRTMTINATIKKVNATKQMQGTR